MDILAFKQRLYIKESGFSGGSVVKTPPANAGDAGWIIESRRSSGEGNAAHSSILAWKIPWTEEAGGLQSKASENQTRLNHWAHMQYTGKVGKSVNKISWEQKKVKTKLPG